MFIMEVPYAPAQQTPIVLAQASAPAAGNTPQPDFILNACKETVSTGDPRSAERAVDPAGMFQNYLGSYKIDLAAVKTTLVEDTTHGKITAVVDNLGRTWYRYDPIPNYIGNDKAVFMAEFMGKHYKIVVELHVFMGVAPGALQSSDDTCPRPKLIKVNGKPVSGSSASDLNVAGDPLTSWLNLAQLDGAMANATGITDNVAGGAVGHNGTNITLDTTAAGNGWHIGTAPGLNEESLPTSNPNEWVARVGSAPYGGMHY